jgi:hypothetical protein
MFMDMFSHHFGEEAFKSIKSRIAGYTVEPGYNDIGLCDTSSIASDILW